MPLFVRGVPRHVENLFAGPHESLGRSVAFQAPFHVEGVDFPHQRHLIDLPVTGLTPDAFVDVNAVIEIDKIGKVVDAHPFDGVARAITFADGFEKWAFGPDLGVAGHAGFNGGDIGKRGFFNRGVTIPTIDAHAGHMVFVAKGNGLFFGNLNIGCVVQSVGVEQNGEARSNDNQNRDDADSGKCVATTRKKLRHVMETLKNKDENTENIRLSVSKT